mgnify:CR=1 FL=1
MAVENEEGQDPSPFGTSMTMEEIEQSLEEGKAGEGTKTDTKLEGDVIPENFRGKTIDDVLQENQRLQDSLRLRDAETATYRTALETRGTQQQVQQQVVDAPKELTREELAEIYAEDPLKAIEVMNDQAIRRAEQHLAVRLGSIEQGTISAAEAQARAKYPDEFELFGDDLIKFKNQMPNQGIFASTKGWEDMISYIRGQDGNIEKLIAKRTGNLQTPSSARQKEQANAGFSRSTQRSTSVGNAREATPEQKQVAEGLGMTVAEYLKWDKVGR